MLSNAERLSLLTLLSGLPGVDESNKYEGSRLEDHFSAEQKIVFEKARKILNNIDRQNQRLQHLKGKMAAICMEADRIKALSEYSMEISKILTDGTWNDIKAAAPKNCIK